MIVHLLLAKLNLNHQLLDNIYYHLPDFLIIILII